MPDAGNTPSRSVTWYLWTARHAAAAIQTLPIRACPLATAGVAADPAALRFEDAVAARQWYLDNRGTLLDVSRGAAAAGLDHGAALLALVLAPLHDAVGEPGAWIEIAQTALAAARRLDDRRLQADVLQTLGHAYKAAGLCDAAARCHHDALEIYTGLGARDGELDAINGVGLVHLEQGRAAEALEHFQRALAMAPEHGLRAAILCNNMAAAHADLGQDEPATRYAHQAFDAYHRLNANPNLKASPLLTLARVCRRSGALDEARFHLGNAENILDGVRHDSIRAAVVRERTALGEATRD